MKNFLTLLILIFSGLGASGQGIAIENTPNFLFTVSSKSGSNPNFSVTGTLNNPTQKFSPYSSNVDTGDYIVGEYVIGATKKTATFEITSITGVSGNTLTLGVVNRSGYSIGTFPGGTLSVVRPTGEGLPAATNESDELRASKINHLLKILDALGIGDIVDTPAGVDDLAVVCIADGDPDTIPSLAVREAAECPLVYDSVHNKYYFYDGARDSLYRWFPLDSLPFIALSGKGMEFDGDSLEFGGNGGIATFKLYYDASNYFRILVNSSGAVSLDATGASAGITLNDPLYVVADPYDSGWNGDGSAARKDDIYDKVNSQDGEISTLITDLTAAQSDVTDLQTLSGRPANSTDQGTFSGATIPNGSDTHEALQAIETSHEALITAVGLLEGELDNIEDTTADHRVELDSFAQLSGLPKKKMDYGTGFTGDIIPNYANAKEAFQALETAVESVSGSSPDSLIALADETGENFGTRFTGDIIPNYATIPEAFQALEDETEGAIQDAGIALSGVSTLSVFADSAAQLMDESGENFGTRFSGSTIPNYATIPDAFQALETAVESAGGGGGRAASRATEISIFDDFVNSLGVTNRYGEHGWTATVATGTIANQADSSTYGAVTITGHGTNAFSCYLSIGSTQTTTPTFPITRNADMIVEFRAKHNVASTPIGVGYMYGGLVGGSSGVTQPNNGIYFIFADNGADLQVTGQTRNGTSASSTAGSTYSNSATPYHIYRIEYDHSAGSAEYFVDGASIGTVSATMPATTTQMRLELAFYTPIGQGGGGARSMTIDYFYYSRAVTR